jgi:hypothetical protein
VTLLVAALLAVVAVHLSKSATKQKLLYKKEPLAQAGGSFFHDRL